MKTDDDVDDASDDKIGARLHGNNNPTMKKRKLGEGMAKFRPTSWGRATTTLDDVIKAKVPGRRC